MAPEILLQRWREISAACSERQAWSQSRNGPSARYFQGFDVERVEDVVWNGDSHIRLLPGLADQLGSDAPPPQTQMSNPLLEIVARRDPSDCCDAPAVSAAKGWKADTGRGQTSEIQCPALKDSPHKPALLSLPRGTRKYGSGIFGRLGIDPGTRSRHRAVPVDRPRPVSRAFALTFPGDEGRGRARPCLDYPDQRVCPRSKEGLRFVGIDHDAAGCVRA